MANKNTSQQSADNASSVVEETPKVTEPTVGSTYMKVRNVVGRPLEINFSDGGDTQRIPSKSTAYIDEQRLANSQLAKNQVDRYVDNNCLRVLKRNTKKEG